MKKYREYRDDYLNVYLGDRIDASAAVTVYCGKRTELFGALNQWAVDNRKVEHSTATRVESFGFHVDDKIRMGRMQQALREMRDANRTGWTQEARDTCHRLERKLFEIFNLLDDAMHTKDESDDYLALLTSELSEAKRVAAAAVTAAAELKARAKGPRIRKLIGTE